MKTTHTRSLAAFALSIATIFSFSSCLTSAKIDKYVSSQFNDQLPKVDKKKQKAELTVNSTINSKASTSDAISTTVSKTSKVLPLIVYWSYDYRHTTSLNPAIPVANFTNAINSQFTKTYSDKLNGKRLELTVEQAPTEFAQVDKAHAIFVLVYLIQWDRIYVEADQKDLVVSYKLLDGEKTAKTGKITVQNPLKKNKDLRFFQSWKSAVSEHLGNYNVAITTMAKDFLKQLAAEL